MHELAPDTGNGSPFPTNVNVFHTLKALLVREEVSHNNPYSYPICLFSYYRPDITTCILALPSKVFSTFYGKKVD